MNLETSQPKQFKTFSQQVELLKSRGMAFNDDHQAEEFLSKVNYYRLSGYWYPMRNFDSQTKKALDSFQPDTSFDLVISLYQFDKELRHAIFSLLDPVEMAIRTMLGHELGRINPLIHLHQEVLGAGAKIRRKGSKKTAYDIWFEKYKTALDRSKEVFVEHHKQKYEGNLPIWAAVEIMDWGLLSHLYSMAPNIARNRVAEKCALTAPQLESWLKSLNILRNYAAHHARVFNRVYDIKPKLNRTNKKNHDKKDPDKRLVSLEKSRNRVFVQLSLIQYLHLQLELSPATVLPELLNRYPDNKFVPFSRLGAPSNWQRLPLWKIKRLGL